MSKEESKMLQGISVLAMVCLRLFDNLNYLDMEINFYKVLHKRLGSMSNISFVDA